MFLDASVASIWSTIEKSGMANTAGLSLGDGARRGGTVATADVLCSAFGLNRVTTSNGEKPSAIASPELPAMKRTGAKQSPATISRAALPGLARTGAEPTCRPASIATALCSAEADPPDVLGLTGCSLKCRSGGTADVSLGSPSPVPGHDRRCVVPGRAAWAAAGAGSKPWRRPTKRCPNRSSRDRRERNATPGTACDSVITSSDT
jgi:hypothetical protein